MQTQNPEFVCTTKYSSSQLVSRSPKENSFLFQLAPGGLGDPEVIFIELHKLHNLDVKGLQFQDGKNLNVRGPLTARGLCKELCRVSWELGVPITSEVTPSSFPFATGETTQKDRIEAQDAESRSKANLPPCPQILVYFPRLAVLLGPANLGGGLSDFRWSWKGWT